MKVDFYRHSLSAKDATAVAQVLDSPFLTTGRVAQAVEAQLSAYFSIPYAILVNSWTNGAVAVLLALDLKPGDEVIVPAMTFASTANVVVSTPIPISISPGSIRPIYVTDALAWGIGCNPDSATSASSPIVHTDWAC
jgi:UDP-4-amino-4-deoxy-L-arabinose-oxoglutarate aminotransferase